VRRDLLQDCQVRFRVTVLQEFLHTDRREGCHDGGISPLIRKFDGGATSHPAAPRKPDAIDAMAPVPTAPEPNATLLGVLLCLPTAPALPKLERAEISVRRRFFGQLSGKQQLASKYICVVP
jgi:hypothetical protein